MYGFITSAVAVALLLSSSLDTAANAAAIQKSRHFDCGTTDPSSDFLSHVNRFHQGQSGGDVSGDRAADDFSNRSLSVSMYIHVVSTNASKASVTNKMIIDQINVLISSFKSQRITFKIQSIDRTLNDTWATGSDDINMKRKLRRGSYSALNLYFQTDLGTNLLGKCTLPGTTSPGSNTFYSDGCNILAASMPGGNAYQYNLGGTAVHEVGHWFGLLHTFQGLSCSGTGDFIDDTPAQSIATDGCPAGQDSCPTVPGLDAIHNFMDYSYDSCYTNFTNGQNTRMFQMWDTFRNGK